MDKAAKRPSLRDRVMAHVAKQKFRDWKLALVLAALLLAALILIARSTESKLVKYSIAEQSSAAETDGVLRVSFAGDIMLGRNIKKLASRIGYERIFARISEVLGESDIAMANLDTCIVDDALSNHTPLYSKDVYFDAKSDSLSAVARAGFDILSLATDHIADYGTDTVMNAAYAAEKYGMSYVGVGVDSTMASTCKTYDVDGTRVSIFGMVGAFPNEYGAKEGRAGVYPATNANTTLYINDAFEKSDLVIVYIHWGEEDMLTPSEEMRTLAQSFIDAGASIVVGSNPRVVLPVELYKRGVIIYSVGSLVFDDASSRNCDSTLASYVRDENGNSYLEFVPLRINSGIPSMTDKPFYANRIFGTLTKKLPESCYHVDEASGKLIVTLESFGY